MRTVIAGILCLAAGLVGGAWSARGEIGELREQSDRLRRERDRAKKAKTAADLAMMARLGQAGPRHEAGAASDEAPAPPAKRPSAPPEAIEPSIPDGSVPGPDAHLDPFASPIDRRLALEEFARDAGLSEKQRVATKRLGADFQRELEEVLGGAIARFALAQATGQEPRPRDVAMTADSLLHTYLDADDRFRDLLDEDQMELLEDSEFDVLWLIDFEAIGKMAERSVRDAER